MNRSRTFRRLTDHARRAVALAAATTLTVTCALVAPAQGAAPSAQSVTGALSVPKKFKVKGSGFGHGIGMSQYGAYQMARTGKSANRILSYYYTGAKVKWRKVPGSSRIQLYAGSGKVDVVIRGGRAKLAGAKATRAHRGTYPSGTRFKLKTNRAGQVEIRVRGKLVGRLAKGKRLQIKWENTRYYKGKGKGVVTASLYRAGTKRPASHGTYRYGRLDVRNISGRVNVVNVLKTNTEYLYGLGEMPSLWGQGKGNAALQAQAIAARNYALINGPYKASCDCNLYDDVRSQYFSGYAKESSMGGQYWKNAVKRTTKAGGYGKVITVKGKLVQAFFYSASGGASLNSEDVWASKIDYLRSKKDPYSLKAPGNPNKTWTAYVSQSRVKRMFPGLKNVVKLKVVARYKGGAAKKLLAIDSKGKRAYFTGKSDTVRNALGLKSDWIRGISRA